MKFWKNFLSIMEAIQRLQRRSVTLKDSTEISGSVWRRGMTSNPVSLCGSQPSPACCKRPKLVVLVWRDIMSASKVRRKLGRVEFLSNLPRIRSMIDAGYNLACIHDALVGEKLLTTSYVTFCRHVRKYMVQQNSLPSTAPVSTPQPLVTPRISPAAPSPKTGFLKPEDVDAKSLF